MTQKSENRKSVDQKREVILGLLAERSELFSRQGSVQRSWRWYKGTKLGPFFRLTYRDQGGQRTVYLGKDRALAEAVGNALRQLQAPTHWVRHLDERLKQLRRDFRKQKQDFRQQVAQCGLQLKGNELRGWRSRGKLAPAIRRNCRGSRECDAELS